MILKKMGLLLFTGAVLLMPLLNASAEGIEPVPNALEKIYMTMLQEEGYIPKLLEEHEGILFKYEGGSYIIRVSENDPQTFFVLYPAFWPIESEVERLKVYTKLDYVNYNVSVAKFFISKDSVSGAVELYIENPNNIKPVFNRIMKSIQKGTAMFINAMKE